MTDHKMKIIITGSSGFVGQNLSNFLIQEGHNVENLSLRKTNWRLDDACDAVIHLAGKAHDIDVIVEDQEYFSVNTDLTTKLFDDFLKTEIRDFFYFSSVKAVADSVDKVLTEECLPAPKTAYGKSKLQAEEYLLSQNLPAGKRLFIIRPCMIHGPGNKGNLNLLYKVVNKGIPWPLASFNNQRSFLSIDNLDFLILNMLKNVEIPSGIYNFADDERLSTNELVRIIANNCGKEEKLWKINVSLVSGLAKMGNVFKLPLNSERLKKLTESYVVSNQKIKSVLGIDNLPLTAKEGLSLTIKSFHK